MNDPNDEYTDWKKKENSRWTKVSKNIKPIHIFLSILLLFVGQFLSSSGKFPQGIFIGIIVAVIIVFIFLAFKESEKKLIPEHIIKQIAQEALERKRKEGLEIPFDCEVRVTLVGEPIYETDFISGTSGIIKREVGFEIIQKGYKKKGVIGIHPFNGIILGIRFESLGYTGKETKDRVIIPIKFED